jgi:hypothetical protein
MMRDCVSPATLQNSSMRDGSALLRAILNRRTEGHASLGSFSNGNHGSFTTSLVQMRGLDT